MDTYIPLLDFMQIKESTKCKHSVFQHIFTQKLSMNIPLKFLEKKKHTTQTGSHALLYVAFKEVEMDGQIKET